MKKIYILDVAGYLFRSYYALPRMTNVKGESTHALYGFVRSVLKIFKDFQPEYIVAVFDGPQHKRQRTEMYADYKSTRVHVPEDLPHQFEWVSEFCRLYGIPQLSIEGVEADDTIGSVAKWISQHDFEVYLCSGDKDLCQLVSSHIFLLQTHKENLLLDSKKVEEVYGVPPELIVDYLALTGDQSDNIPGVPGFGPKTAVSLLKQFGSLENLLQNATQIPGAKKQETLLQNTEQAQLSKRLALIDTSVEFPKQESFFKCGTIQELELFSFYERMNYNTLTKERPQLLPAKIEYTLVDDEEALEKMWQEWNDYKEICFDTQTTSLIPMTAELLGMSFAVDVGKAWYISATGNLGLNRLIIFLKTAFADPRFVFCGHHVKFNTHILANYHIEVKRVSFDTMLASYLLYAHSNRHSLEHLGQLYLGYAQIENVKEHCCLDVDFISQLKIKLNEELEKRHLHALLSDLELPVSKVLGQLERRGIYVDVPYLQQMSLEMQKQIASLEEEIYKIAGENFNLNSPKQLSHVLYDKLGIEPLKKTATGQASTSAEVLESLTHPIGEKIIEYRMLEKLRSTYVDALPGQINVTTGRIHCTFNQAGTTTGRLSCQDPNLQNIPVRTEAGRRIRQAFRPQREGWSFIAADYSQIELRILAHLSEDPELIKAFEHDEDIHAYTASLILGIPLKEVTKEQRYQAKAVNFGIVYGQQAFGLARELKISVKKAAEFIEAYFDRYKGVKKFMELCKEETRTFGKTVTMSGRERLIPDMNSKNPTLRAAAERLAINTPLQGSAADLIKKAMLDVENSLQQKQAMMILQIHDELLFEVPDHEIEEVSSLVKEKMERVFSLKVPLKVDIAVGKNWKEC